MKLRVEFAILIAAWLIALIRTSMIFFAPQ